MYKIMKSVTGAWLPAALTVLNVPKSMKLDLKQ